MIGVVDYQKNRKKIVLGRLKQVAVTRKMVLLPVLFCDKFNKLLYNCFVFQNKKYLGFVSRKLHSLLGFIPLGFFLFEHLLANSTALFGEETFGKAVEFLENIPGLWVLEVFLIALPLLFHAVLGLIIALQAVNNPRSYSYLRNWMFYLQRISGLIILAFTIYHLFTVKFSSSTGLSFYQILQNQLSNTFVLCFYILSLTAAAFHFCNGLWGFAVNWGIITGPKSQKYFGYVTLGLFVIFNFLWLKVLSVYI